MHQAYIALGSNIQNPIDQIKSALTALSGLPKTELLKVSSFYRNPPVGMIDQPDFINAVAKIMTSFTASELLDKLLAIEHQQQRIRKEKNGPRTLDLDLLLYKQSVIKSPMLEVPHPRMHQRAFVLLPLAEIEPDLILPCGTSVQYFLKTVDTSELIKVEMEIKSSLDETK